MFRRFLDSPWPYFLGASILFVLAVASQFDVRIPSRDVAGVEEVERLKDRDDLNVVFILIDTLRSDRLGMYGYERLSASCQRSISSDPLRISRESVSSILFIRNYAGWLHTSCATDKSLCARVN